MSKKWLWLLLIACGTASAQCDSVYCECGIASYYARAFEGRRCSNGQLFRHDNLTAAHKTLKFGTLVKVTNLKNDSFVIVRVTDRLPKYSTRSIDLTRRAAKQLNFIPQGLAKVKIEIVEENQKKLVPVDTLTIPVPVLIQKSD